MKLTFMGAGSTIFVRRVIGDCMCSDITEIRDAEFALYDIDAERLKESLFILEAIRREKGSNAKIECYHGVENRKAALKGADFVVNAIQVGGYDPCTIIDFEVPKKYGLRQTIADTSGIGGIMRALRTIPVMEDFVHDMEEVCPDALFMNYTNPMSMLTGYIQRYTNIKTVGLCHSVQICAEHLFKDLGIDLALLDGRKELIAGINHMAWLLEIKDKNGNDLYPMIKKLADERMQDPTCRFKTKYQVMKQFGYFMTEGPSHHAEYYNFFIKDKYPEMIEEYNILLDDYIGRCIRQIAEWKEEYAKLQAEGVKEHVRSHEYASRIVKAIITNTPYEIGGNVLNTDHLITNLPANACVEVPCLVNGHGINPCHVGDIPVQLAALNMTHINVHLLVQEAARTKKRDYIYQAALLEPRTSSQLNIDDIRKMVDELIDAHGNYLPKYN